MTTRQQNEIARNRAVVNYIGELVDKNPSISKNSVRKLVRENGMKGANETLGTITELVKGMAGSNATIAGDVYAKLKGGGGEIGFSTLFDKRRPGRAATLARNALSYLGAKKRHYIQPNIEKMELGDMTDAVLVTMRQATHIMVKPRGRIVYDLVTPWGEVIEPVNEAIWADISPIPLRDYNTSTIMSMLTEQQAGKATKDRTGESRTYDFVPNYAASHIEFDIEPWHPQR